MVATKRRGSNEDVRPVAVYGAAGHTGRFVLNELASRGIPALAVGRDADKLEPLRAQVRGVYEASLDDAAALDDAFRQSCAVINCAGPFLDTAETIAAAALKAGAHYLDVTAEQPSVLATYEKFHAPSKQAGLVFIPAMGFYGGFADLLVSALAEGWREVDEIEIGIALDSWHPTLGSRRTGERNKAPRQVVLDHALTPVPLPAEEKSWNFLPPFGPQQVSLTPFSEIIVINRHIRSRSIRNYLNIVGLRDVRDPKTPAPVPADESGRSAQIFRVEAVVKRGSIERHISATGRDIYAFTAPLVCEALQRILAGDAKEYGALAPGSIFDARAFLDALAPGNLTYEIAGI